jgi:trimethylamine--corrinoid protein Co-methyltransferase
MTYPYLHAAPRARVFSDAQIQQIHLATLELLERTGVQITHVGARAMLYSAGARVDGNRVRIPSHLVEDALRRAPHRVVLGKRDGSRSLFLEECKYYYGASLDCPDYLDPETNERRPFTRADCRRSAALADALPNYAWVMTCGMAADAPAALADRTAVKDTLTHCAKPLVFICKDAQSARDIFEMASLIAGGAERFRQAPFLVHYSEPVSPLVHFDPAVDKLLFCAEQGIPLIYFPAPMCGGTAPATFAGAIVQASAESLSGLLLAQLAHPGAPFIYGAFTTIMDMTTTVFSYAAPEMSLMVAGITELAHFYGLPVFGTAGCSDAKFPDQQAAAEAAFSCFSSALCGANLIHDCGWLDHGALASPAHMTLVNEILYMVRQYMGGIPVNDETLALDVINQVGPGGHYLNEEHTLRHFRDVWYSRLFDRTIEAQWVERGAQRFDERLRELTLKQMAQQPAPLPAEVLRELDRMSDTWK